MVMSHNPGFFLNYYNKARISQKLNEDRSLEVNQDRGRSIRFLKSKTLSKSVRNVREKVSQVRNTLRKRSKCQRGSLSSPKCSPKAVKTSERKLPTSETLSETVWNVREKVLQVWEKDSDDNSQRL